MEYYKPKCSLLFNDFNNFVEVDETFFEVSEKISLKVFKNPDIVFLILIIYKLYFYNEIYIIWCIYLY